MKKIPKYLKILLINFILISYLSELLLFFFIADEQKRLVQIHETRLNIAKNLGLKFDTRSKERAFTEIKEKIPNLEPSFYFNRGFANYETFQKALSLGKPIPFRGPINKQSLSCAEDLNYKLINNDKFGFKNPNNVYEKKIDLILIGDSYAEGQCYEETNDIAAYLREKKYNSLNFGVTGSGPLVSLGILREYAKKFKPGYVVYLYYEGNDISDLSWEKNNIILKNYLNENFNQNLLNNKNGIENFLHDISKDSYKYINSRLKFEKSSNNQVKRFLLLEQLKDFLELSNLRNFIKNYFYLFVDNEFDEKFFLSVIKKMEEETISSGGKFIFVYTPSWSRYFTKFTKEQRYIGKKNSILSILKKNNILILDLTEFFDSQNDLEQYFPLGYFGHYNKNGYKKISDILVRKIIEINE